MLQDSIDAFEELKKYVFIVDRGELGKIIIKFHDENFYHLIGLHKIDFDLFLPYYLKTKVKKYKYIKNHINKYDKILDDLTLKKYGIKRRITTLHNLVDLLKNDKNTKMYNLKERRPNSLYNGDFGLLKEYENLRCLLGLKEIFRDGKIISCSPQSWIVDDKEINLIKNRPSHYLKGIIAIPANEYNDKYVYN